MNRNNHWEKKNDKYRKIALNRSSHSEVFLGNYVLKICSKFTGEHPCRSVISIKWTPLGDCFWLNNYHNSQMELKRTIEHHITENIEKKLKTIAQQGLDSKPFWNILRQMKRNNSEDLIAIKDDKGNILFSEEEIKLHTELL